MSGDTAKTRTSANYGAAAGILVEDQIPFAFDDTPKRLCVRCRKRQVYLDIKTMDYCEPCIWDVVKKDMESLRATADLTKANGRAIKFFHARA